MKFRKLSLRLRIFLSMIVLILIASILMAGITIFQYNEEAKEYHNDRLERKEAAVLNQIRYVLRNTTYEVKTDNVHLIFKDAIFELAAIHNLSVNFYDFDGFLLVSSMEDIKGVQTKKKISLDVLSVVANTLDKRYVEKFQENGESKQSAYKEITDTNEKPLAILNLEYDVNNEWLNSELEEFLERLVYVYLFMFIIAVTLAYFLSKYITRSLKAISDRLNQTTLDKRNAKIEGVQTSEEIKLLVNAYNSMIDELEESAVKLATSEREQAWREMAKQVAHEIKNPLTPMRLTVQSFQRKFDPSDENIHQKLNEYSKTLIQQIDTMSSIASAFSSFAKMPAQKNETLNVTEIVRLALDIFNENNIVFHADSDEIIAVFDRTQLIRVVTNLVKNAIQAKSPDREPNIVVSVKESSQEVIITVSDNGIGISESNKPRVFEPKFTTKTSGMGLGLPMIKNIIETYKGTITFESQEGAGTVFTVTLPKS